MTYLNVASEVTGDIGDIGVDIGDIKAAELDNGELVKANGLVGLIGVLIRLRMAGRWRDLSRCRGDDLLLLFC